MSNLPIYLAKFRLSLSQRAHFAVFIPNVEDAAKDPNDKSTPCRGTLINVVGLPMAGYTHEFKQHRTCAESVDFERVIQIGIVQAAGLQAEGTNEAIAKAFETVALQIPAPRKNQNFMAPVNDTTNRRCQEWTMDYLRLLVDKDHISAEAVEAAQAERDPPNHGIGLRPTATGTT